MTHIKPPVPNECTWRSGPPPDVGWWPASAARRPDCLRWWNGEFWSSHVWADEPEKVAGRYAERRGYNNNIQWTDRWWLK